MDIVNISKFQFNRFFEFDDNSREGSECFEERSERRHIYVFKLFAIFMESYTSQNSIKLFDGFQIFYRIEQSLVFSNASVRSAALELCSMLLGLGISLMFSSCLPVVFPVILESSPTNYEKKIGVIRTIEQFLNHEPHQTLNRILTANIRRPTQPSKSHLEAVARALHDGSIERRPL